MLKKIYQSTIAGFFLVFIFSGIVGAKEPSAPNVNKALSPGKEARISQLERGSLKQCFEQLKETEFFLDDDFSSKTAYRCFRYRIESAVQYAIDKLKNNQYTIEGEKVVFNNDLQVAKTVARVFPSHAEVSLLNEYKEGNAQTKANILLVLGSIPGNRATSLLVKSLNDQSVYEEPFPGMEGEPLRICDMAYNQLRLRYAEELTDMPRMIGNPDRVEKRDFYIDEMKGRF